MRYTVEAVAPDGTKLYSRSYKTKSAANRYAQRLMDSEKGSEFTLRITDNERSFNNKSHKL